MGGERKVGGTHWIGGCGCEELKGHGKWEPK